MDDTEQTLIRVQLTEERVRRMVTSDPDQTYLHHWLQVEQILKEFGAECDSNPFSYHWEARFTSERQALLFILRYG